MKNILIIFVASLLVALQLCANTQIESSAFEPQSSISFNERIKPALKEILKKNTIASTMSKNLTRRYYEKFDYLPFWMDEKGIKPIALDLMHKIENDSVLKPYSNQLFNLKVIQKQIQTFTMQPNDESLIVLDIMLTNAYNQYMNYLSYGIIDWEKFEEFLTQLNEKDEIIAHWKKYDVRKNVRKLLYDAIKSDDLNIAINEVEYTFPKALELSKNIEKFEALANNGGYIKIPSISSSLKMGNTYPQIKFIRQRLLQSEDLHTNECVQPTQDNTLYTCQDFFDENLFNAVKSFQKNHGLVEDGVIGKNTLLRMNIPIEQKIETMRMNLERMRWLPRNLGEKYFLVNIPEYKLRIYEQNQLSMNMDVIVGEEKHPTPIFSHQVSAIILNPYWRIPQRIVKNEIIPKLVENPNYLVENEIKVFENWSHDSMTYDTSAVDWGMYVDNDLIGTSKEAPMRFIQIPGKLNPLGKMKFMFPNRYSVYMHDTPFKSLFKKNRRAFSHGCIRLSQPQELLKYISTIDSSVNFDKANEILKEIEKTDIDLQNKIPVHIVYITSWVDEEGKVQFRDDIYNYDKVQKEIIRNQTM